MPKIVDLTGKIFERITVIEFSGKRENGASLWKCKCSCGNYKIIRGDCLNRGDTRSCGCIVRENSLIHGLSKTIEYKSWSKMISRCLTKTDKAFRNYGGRGIKVCKEWINFENFYKDMGKKPSKDHSIDRIDNNGDYEPKNCRWATPREQAQNRRYNVKYKGETAAEASRRFGGNENLVNLRIRQYGWEIEKAFTTPIQDPIINLIPCYK